MRCVCLASALALAATSIEAFSPSFHVATRTRTTATAAGFVGISNRDTRSSPSGVLLTSTASSTTQDVAEARTDLSSQKPGEFYDSIVCGAGPAGLLTAIMLAQKYGPTHRIALCEQRPQAPPSPTDETVWNDVARFYLLGIGFRGQTAMEKFGVLDDFLSVSVGIEGRRDWAPGATNATVTPARKGVTSQVLPRDKLVGVLYYHLLENYIQKQKANVDLLYGYTVDPVDFGGEKEGENDEVTVRISKSDGSANDSVTTATTKLLIGSDGSARTIANKMEEVDRGRVAKLNPISRLFSDKPFKVTRFEDDNPRVFKSVPVQLPADWPHSLNYSARSKSGRVTFEALPSDGKGSLCALLLMKPDEPLAQADTPAEELRSFFEDEFPQFSALISDDVMASVAAKPASPLPSFRYVGPRLNMGRRTVVLGDAAHTVKPYYGLGANTALEDVQMLSDALDEAAATKANAAVADGNSNTSSSAAVPGAVKMFSDRRAADSNALVTISRNMDRPGKLFFFTFVLPLILDGIFHKLAPRLFGPNMFAMFQKRDMGFRDIQVKKRLDRLMQVSILGGMASLMAYALKRCIWAVSRSLGVSRGIVSGSFALLMFACVQLKKMAGGRKSSATA